MPAVAGRQPRDRAKGCSLALVGEIGFRQVHAGALHRRPRAGRRRSDHAREGSNIAGLSRAKLRPYRKALQMVFQDPFASLNPRWRVGDIIAQGPIVERHAAQDRARAKPRELLRLVGLDPKAADRYPHEFSGGQRQRIGIARALAVKPKLIIADEPVSALDVSVQKQVLELLDELRTDFDLSMLFITHDLRVAAHVCEEIAVMKDGVIVERATTADIFATPSTRTPKALLASVPGRDWQLKRLLRAQAPLRAPNSSHETGDGLARVGRSQATVVFLVNREQKLIGGFEAVVRPSQDSGNTEGASLLIQTASISQHCARRRRVRTRLQVAQHNRRRLRSDLDGGGRMGSPAASKFVCLPNQGVPHHAMLPLACNGLPGDATFRSRS
mgnify:CR=1 FL=1